MGKDIKIGLGLAIILILFLIAFLMTNTSKETPRESLTEDDEADVIIGGAQGSAAAPADETLFYPPEEPPVSPAPAPEGSLFEGDTGLPPEESPVITSIGPGEELPAPSPVVPAPVVRAPRKYTVRAGDNLQDIAKEFYGDAGKWQLIQRANDNIDPRKLRVGMVLIIPDLSAEAGRTPPQSPAPGKTHTVARDDSLWNIAQKYYGDGNKYKLIMKANNISDPKALVVGQVLKIPPAE